MTRSLWEKDGRRPRMSFDLVRVIPPKADAANRMTRSLWEKDGRRPRMSFNLVRVIPPKVDAADK